MKIVKGGCILATSTQQDEITQEYYYALCNALLDFDDEEYADRYVDRVLKKHLGVDHPFDQVEYINMLDADVRRELIDFLSDPQAVHDKRTKAKRKSSRRQSSSSNASIELKVRYEDYPDGNLKVEYFTGHSLIDALKKMVDTLLLYIDVQTIEEDEMSADDVLRAIETSNGDGCDYIITMENTRTGQLLMDFFYDEYAEELE